MTTINNLVERLRADPQSCVEFLRKYDSYARSVWVKKMMSHSAADSLADAIVTGQPVDIVPVPPSAPGWAADCDRAVCDFLCCSLTPTRYSAKYEYHHT